MLVAELSAPNLSPKTEALNRTESERFRIDSILLCKDIHVHLLAFE